MKKINLLKIGLLLAGFIGLSLNYVYCADSFKDNFDQTVSGNSVDGINSWEVISEDKDLALTQNLVSYGGSGNSLELLGDENVAQVTRADSYGGVSPCWVEYLVRPGLGSERDIIPGSKIGAVSFDYTSQILASDQNQWVDTGMTFSPGSWYKVDMKLDFSSHTYDLYVTLVQQPESAINLVKSGLRFGDANINSLSKIGFSGCYSVTQPDETYVDNVVVHFVDSLRVSTSPSSVAKNVASSAITVQLVNSQNEPQTAWKDIVLSLNSTSTTGQFSQSRESWVAINEVTIPEGSNEVTVYYKDSTKGKPTITINEYPDQGFQDAVIELEVIESMSYYDIAASSPQTAGQQFEVEITAKDEGGGLDTNYNGTVDVTAEYVNPDSGTKSIIPNTVTGFVNGKVKTNLAYNDCGIITLRVQDTVNRERLAHSSEIIFRPSKFNVIADSILAAAGEMIGIKLQAINYQGEVTPNYKGSVFLNPLAVFPENIDGGQINPLEVGPFAEGEASVDVSYNLWGTIKIQAQDKDYSGQRGESQEIKFQPASLGVSVNFSPTRQFFYTGEKFALTISCLDRNGQIMTNYQGKVSLGSSMYLNLPSEYTFTLEDKGQKVYYITVYEPGEYKIWVQDQDSAVKGESPAITVKTATLVVNPPSDAPIGVVEVPIQLVDENGTLIVDNDVYVTIGLDEENMNSSAYSTAVNTPVQLVNGMAKIIIGDSQAEFVTITPISIGSFKFNIKKGSIRFGRMSKTGIGSLIWREIKQ